MIIYSKTTPAGSGFIPLSAIKAAECDHWEKPDPALRLLNHVTVKPGFESIAEALLGNVVITEDLDQAIALYKRNGIHQTIVTKNGNVISPMGIMIGGSKDNLAGILEKKHEIKELKLKISSLTKEIANAQSEFEAVENELRDLENGLQKLLAQQHTISNDEIEAEKALYKISEDLKHAQRHLEIVRLEQEQLMGEELDIDEEMTKYHKALGGN